MGVHADFTLFHARFTVGLFSFSARTDLGQHHSFREAVMASSELRIGHLIDRKLEMLKVLLI